MGPEYGFRLLSSYQYIWELGTPRNDTGNCLGFYITTSSAVVHETGRWHALGHSDSLLLLGIYRGYLGFRVLGLGVRGGTNG